MAVSTAPTSGRPASRELFVYYRVAAIDAQTMRTKVDALQAELREKRPFLVTRLLRRPDAVDGLQTWMEIYATAVGHSPPGITPTLQALIETEAARLLPFLAASRHVEVFEHFETADVRSTRG